MSWLVHSSKAVQQITVLGTYLWVNQSTLSYTCMECCKHLAFKGKIILNESKKGGGRPSLDDVFWLAPWCCGWTSYGTKTQNIIIIVSAVKFKISHTFVMLAIGTYGRLLRTRPFHSVKAGHFLALFVFSVPFTWMWNVMHIVLFTLVGPW